jgi:anti-sigma-K factor RskA
VNIKDYIESGILEAYILSALSTEEHADVAANIAMYPELRKEVTEIEIAMQRFAEANAEEPPAYLLDKIWNALDNDGQAVTNPLPTQTTPKTIALPQQVHDKQWQRAAIWIALIGSLAANYILWGQKKNSDEQVATTTTHIDTMQVQQQKLVATVAAFQKVKDMMADTSMQTIVLQTVAKGMPMAATVYWSRNKGDTYLMVDKMPMPPAGKQYQMWAIKDGKPVDMGVLSNDLIASVDGMNKLPMAIIGGQAFAISLEKEGGNPTPTQVCVMGKVAAI